MNLYIRGIYTGNDVLNLIGDSPKDGLNDLIILENFIPQGMIGEQKKPKRRVMNKWKSERKKI
ncbi:hypothetical protein [Mediterraneibacter gnavus]|uniref:hypothetical protein n=1 Tax=Mediterraneibacter gnavus TaxID=33038 RepID=UPI001FA796DE|nr:hypothetical protein [Mediterraneibacter gnavus]